MKTVVLPGAEGVRLGAELIKKGEIVAFPTETVYGLGADATSESAVAKIFVAKGRPQDNPLIVHLADASEVKDVAYDDGRAKELFEAFAPGPLTLILKKKSVVPDSVTAGRQTVGIRIPAHDDAIALISASRPLAAPSANTSTRPSPTRARDVLEDMDGKIPLIIDGGESGVGIESTILDLTGDVPTILRPGYITETDLAPILGTVRHFGGKITKNPPAPGMKYRHYAPACEMIVSDSAEETLSLYRAMTSEGRDPVVLALGANVARYSGMKVVNMGNNDKEVARNLFSAFRDGEKSGDVIIVEALLETGLGYSVMNRMKKAVSGSKGEDGKR